MRRAVLRFSIRSRRRKARLVVDFMARYGVRSVVLSGALGSGTQINESIVERAVIDAAQLALVCDITLHRPSPWKVVLADGRALPFKDQSLDLALANAVIEHVGSEADQVKFVSEHARVGRHWIITTPNRWFPVEAHTSTLLRHWSSAWRDDRSEFTRLLSAPEFRALLPEGSYIHGRPWSATFTASSAPLS